LTGSAAVCVCCCCCCVCSYRASSLCTRAASSTGTSSQVQQHSCRSRSQQLLLLPACSWSGGHVQRCCTHPGLCSSLPGPQVARPDSSAFTYVMHCLTVRCPVLCCVCLHHRQLPHGAGQEGQPGASTGGISRGARRTAQHSSSQQNSSSALHSSSWGVFAQQLVRLMQPAGTAQQVAGLALSCWTVSADSRTALSRPRLHVPAVCAMRQHMLAATKGVGC
jgi:hypothetical protein